MESGTGNQKEILESYGISLRVLVCWNFMRQFFILLVFGLAILIIKPPAPEYFAFVLPLILHSDEKCGKLQKACSDAKPAWDIVRQVSEADNPLDSPDLSYSVPPRRSLFLYPMLFTPLLQLRRRVHGVVRVVEQLWDILSQGSAYKSKTMGSNPGKYPGEKKHDLEMGRPYGSV